MAKARQAAALDTDDMAAYLGCSERTIRNYERGATHPNRPTLMAWAQRTDVPMWWIDGLEAPEPLITSDKPPESDTVVTRWNPTTTPIAA